MATVAAFAAIGGGAFAVGAIPNSKGEIAACYVKKGKSQGKVRLLVKGKCARREKRISWSQRGPAGQAGDPGPKGEPGSDAQFNGEAAGGALAGTYPNPSLAPGAVTADAISAAGSSAGQLLRSDGASASWATAEFAPEAVRTTVVRATGSATENGAALLAADADTTGTASAPALLKLEPGTYDLGSSNLTMNPYVDIEGSGENATTIVADGRASQFSGTVVGASNAELRHLTVESRGGAASAIAIYMDATSTQLSFVTARASGDTGGGSRAIRVVFNSGPGGVPLLRNTTGIVTSSAGSFANALDVASRPVTVLDSSFSASGPGNQHVAIAIANGRAVLRGVSATASGTGSRGLRVTNLPVQAFASSLSGGSFAVQAESSGTAIIAASALDGAVSALSGGSLGCFAAFDAVTFLARAADCT